MLRHRSLLTGITIDRLPELRDLPADPSAPLTVEGAPTVREALALLAREPYDAAIVWVEDLPHLAGVVQIRRAHPALPIVVLTPSSGPEFLEAAEEAGATRIVRTAPPGTEPDGQLRSLLSSAALSREQSAQTRWKLSQTRRFQLVLDEPASAPSPLPAEFEPILVEDDPDQGFFMTRAFQKAKVRQTLTILATGEQLIQQLSLFLEEDGPDRKLLPPLIILDHHLPGISGLDVLGWIRRQPAFSRLPVILLSSDGREDVVREAYRRGANAFLVKPISFNQLVELVKGLKFYWGVAGRVGPA